jgi:hypothetical protein
MSKPAWGDVQPRRKAIRITSAEQEWVEKTFPSKVHDPVAVQDLILLKRSLQDKLGKSSRSR